MSLPLGFMVTMITFYFAVGVLMRIHLTTVVTSAADAGAHAAASAAPVGAPDRDIPSAVLVGERAARGVLGAASGDATFRWRITDARVELTVTMPAPQLLPRPGTLAGPVTRTATYRRQSTATHVP